MGILTEIKKEGGYIKRRWRKRLFAFFYRKAPVTPNKIIFSNFAGRGLGDSPKYIVEEILRQKLDFDLVWIVNSLDIKIPNGIRKVKAGSIQEAYELSTAKVFISNIKTSMPYVKRSGQYYIQTWHGPFGLKLSEKESESKLRHGYVVDSKEDSKRTDLILSSSKKFTEFAKKSLWYDGEVWESGIPREDPLYNFSDYKKNKLREQYGFPTNCKILIYAPTFRDNGDTSVYDPNLKVVIEKLERYHGGKWIGIVRLHPNLAKANVHFDYNEKLINGNSYPDAQDLLLMSDLLITDYSSIMNDFSYMRKPILLYIPDFEEYKQMRGIRMSLFNELPFPKCYNNTDLLNSIKNFDKEKYELDVDRFLNDYYGNIGDGHASERVVDRIKQIIDGTNK